MYLINKRRLRHRVFYSMTVIITVVAIYKALISVSMHYGTILDLPQNSREWTKLSFGSTSHQIWNQHKRGKVYSQLRHRIDNHTEHRQCQPKKHIVFLKVHKCGSSTVQNILLRFGEKHGLNFVMPRTRNYLGNVLNTTFNKKYMIELPVDTYNILCHHTRFNEKNIAEVMSPDSLYITMLRDPVSMFESIFTYDHFDYVFGIKGATPIQRLNKFLTNPSYFYKQKAAQAFMGHGKNPMLYDSGLENKDKENNTRIEELIMQMSRRFDLVMMADYFYESMILLKDLMCWTIEDVVFFSLNSRTNVTVPSTLTQTMREQIRQWNVGDVKLYDYFNKTFWQKVEEYGVKRMDAEVQLLKEYNVYLFKLCIDRISDNDKNVWHPEGVFVNTFQVKQDMKNDYLCVAMAKSELLYTANLRTKLMKMYGIIKITHGPSAAPAGA